MLMLEQLLDIPRQLEAAPDLLPAWGQAYPVLDGLDSVQAVKATTLRSGSVVNDVLVALAELASSDGGDSVEAAALLCHLVLPAILPTLATAQSAARGRGHDDVVTMVAEQLWIAARTFPWRTRRKVAVTIRWTVRRAVLAELGFVNHLERVDRTWAATTPVPAQRIVSIDVVDPEVPGEEQLDDLLRRAVGSRAVDLVDVGLLWALVHESERFSGRFTTCGLLSEPVTEAVGRRIGVTGRTVRRRAARSIRALRGLVADERSDAWETAA